MRSLAHHGEARAPTSAVGVVAGYGERFASCEGPMRARVVWDRVDCAGLRTPTPAPGAEAV